MTERICSWCGNPAPSWCESCSEELTHRENPDTMSSEERLAELSWFISGDGARCEVPFTLIHKRIEDLMGRPVWTHEFGDADRLLAELTTRLP